MDSKLFTYRIGDAAQRLGISPRTIRYYEELGLINPSRTDGGFRLYSEHDLDVIKLVIRFRDLGMSLEQIGALILQADGAPSADKLGELKNALLSRRREFEEKVAKLMHAIGQIDDVLGQLSRCERCGEPLKEDACRRCSEERDGHLSPLLDRLI